VAKQARPLWLVYLLPLARVRKIPRRLPGRTALRKRRLLRRPRKARLWPTHQPQNFARSIRPSTTRPPLQKRPPRKSTKPLPPRCFSFTQTAVFGYQVLVEQDILGADGGYGMFRKGPRGLTRESFNDCVMFHLLTVIPNNSAEQEKYYLSKVLKKPQRVGIHQFI
jgi:hypothetical protein